MILIFSMVLRMEMEINAQENQKALVRPQNLSEKGNQLPSLAELNLLPLVIIQIQAMQVVPIVLTLGMEEMMLGHMQMMTTALALVYLVNRQWFRLLRPLHLRCTPLWKMIMTIILLIRPVIRLRTVR